jgi:hypothetical protein
MPRQKSYLDLFLDNAYKPKKRAPYFLQAQEDAIIKINSKDTSSLEKFHLYENVLEPAFRRIIYGVLEMPKFHNLMGMNRNDLMEETYCRLVEKLEKFTPGKIGKNGQPVKAYSYFSTIAKNFILEKKVRHEKVLKHKADVEFSIDLHILSEDTLKKMSNYDKQDVHFDSYEKRFSETSTNITDIIDKVIKEEETAEKSDENVIKLGYILKYLITKWDMIEFTKKNEFMRILTLYTGLKQQQVSCMFKRYKTEILRELNPQLLREIEEGTIPKKIKKEIDFEEDISDDQDEVDEVEENNEELKPSYELTTMEDFEQFMEKQANEKVKKRRRKEKRERIAIIKEKEKQLN